MSSPDLVVARLAKLLSDVTGTPVAALSVASTPTNTDGWDSMANLTFIEAIEEEFGITISTAQALRMHSLGEIATFVRAQPSAKPSAKNA